MARSGATTKVFIFFGLAAVCGAVAWWQRTPLLAWHYVNQLSRADEASRERWVERVAELDEAALPRLLPLLESDEAPAGANARAARAALSALARRWGPADGRSATLMVQLVERWAQY